MTRHNKQSILIPLTQTNKILAINNAIKIQQIKEITNKISKIITHKASTISSQYQHCSQCQYKSNLIKQLLAILKQIKQLQSETTIINKIDQKEQLQTAEIYKLKLQKQVNICHQKIAFLQKRIQILQTSNNQLRLQILAQFTGKYENNRSLLVKDRCSKNNRSTASCQIKDLSKFNPNKSLIQQTLKQKKNDHKLTTQSRASISVKTCLGRKAPSYINQKNALLREKQTYDRKISLLLHQNNVLRTQIHKIDHI